MGLNPCGYVAKVRSTPPMLKPTENQSSSDNQQKRATVDHLRRSLWPELQHHRSDLNNSERWNNYRRKREDRLGPKKHGVGP